MTTAEFDRWLDDLEIRFPSVAAWFTKVAPDADSRRRMLRSWCTVMADARSTDCLAVNEHMQAGDMPWVGEYDSDKERLPQHVRRLAKQLAFDTDQPASEYEPPPRPTDFPAGKILVRMQKLVRDGATYEEARDQALKEFPIGKSSREPAYRCHLCLDHGVIEVAHPAAIIAMLRDTFASCVHRIVVVRCRCNNREFPPLQFDPALDFRVDSPCWPAKQVEEFFQWVEYRRNNAAEARAKACANYDQSFAAFNNR